MQRRERAGFCARHGALAFVFAFGCGATFLLLRRQPDLLQTPLYNPFARLDDPYESYSDFSVEIRRDDNVVEVGPALFRTRKQKQVAVASIAGGNATQGRATPVRSRVQPVLGPPALKGARPLFGKQHAGGDAIFALACKYPVRYYERFVGSVRKAGFGGDVVLAVSPLDKMKPGVAEYIKRTDAVAYAFEVDCRGKDDCRLLDEFLGYPDPRPYRTFANIRYACRIGMVRAVICQHRYALYEYWLQFYTRRSYILILDFRDTYFQLDPFGLLPPLPSRRPKYDLRLFAENRKVKTLGTCKFNSFWVKKCFSKEAIVPIQHESVICSGSTMGSFDAVLFYVGTMLRWMDRVQCWRKGIESDQGYQNYLFYYGHFNAPDGSANATLFQQGEGVVNTVGAMNGFRVPKDQRGPLDSFWKVRDKDGFVLNADGSRSACVHQWDRFYSEMQPFIDKYTF